MAIERLQLGQTVPDFRERINQIIDAVNVLTDATISAGNVTATPVGGGEATDVQGILEELNTRIEALEPEPEE